MIAIQQGDHLRAVRKQAKRRKDKATLNQLGSDEPKDDKELVVYVNLFLMLEADRVEQMMPIPLTAMITAIDFFGLDEEQEDFLLGTFAIADPIVLTDRRKNNGNAAAIGDPDASPRGKASRNR